MRPRPFRRSPLSAAILLACLLAPAAKSRAAEFYYVLIFGSQGCPKQLRYTHTWATFVKATGEGLDPAGYAIEAHTISWLPATGVVRVLSPSPEKGVNFDLHQTIRYVQSHGETVNLWGPFRISEPIYRRSLRIHQIIDSGVAEYRAISGPRDLLISDCIHAVAAVDPVFGRNHYPLIRIGKPASRYMARQVMTRSVFVQEENDNAWIIPRLGLDQAAIRVIPPSTMAR